MRHDGDKMKSIFASKTLWLNILGAVATYSGMLPTKYAGPTMAVANIGMRFLTNSSVNIMGNVDR